MAKITPTIYAKALYQATKDLPRNQVEGVIGRFTALLKQRGHLHWGPRISQAFARYAQEHEEAARAVVTVAHELSTQSRNELERQVAEVFGAHEVAIRTDAHLLGGGIIKKGNTIIDMSVRGLLSPLVDA